MTKETKPKKPRVDKNNNIEEKLCGKCNKPKGDGEQFCNCGRPTDYKEEYCKDIVDYFERCQAEILYDIKWFMPNKNVTVEDILNPHAKQLGEEVNTTLQAGAVKQIDQKLVMQRFPTFIRYARTIGVNKTTLYEWADKYEEFSNAMNDCRDIAEAILLENGLQGLYNSTFAQFLLKNNHGYKDKVETEHSGEVKTTQQMTEEQMLMIADRIKNKLGKKD